MAVRVIDLDARRIDETAAILWQAFRDRSASWPDLITAREEVLASLEAGKISRVAIDDDERVTGWIGAFPIYDGKVWEIHPLVVAEHYRRRGIGRALIEDLEALVAARGGLTLWAGSDDEHGETSLGGIDLYPDIPAAMRDIRSLGDHPFEFYRKLGFRVAGVLPDANGPGKPDIFLAKRVRR